MQERFQACCVLIDPLEHLLTLNSLFTDLQTNALRFYYVCVAKTKITVTTTHAEKTFFKY